MTAARESALPVSVRGERICLRREVDDDEPFLERLYRSVRWDELLVVPWPDEVKSAFLLDQHRLQRRHYLAHYSDAEFSIVLRNGEAAGRLYLYRSRADIRIVDVSLLPEARGKGIGTALICAVIEEAAANGQSVSIHVEQFNPAQRLYRRLGFEVISADGPYWLMECRPCANGSEQLNTRISA